MCLSAYLSADDLANKPHAYIFEIEG